MSATLATVLISLGVAATVCLVCVVSLLAWFFLTRVLGFGQTPDREERRDFLVWLLFLMLVAVVSQLVAMRLGIV